MGDIVKFETPEERSMREMLEEMEDEVITGIDYAFTRSDLNEALNSILENPDDWKGTIDAIIPDSRLKICTVACNFFTGTNLWKTPADIPGYWRVRSLGYRAGPCGDH